MLCHASARIRHRSRDLPSGSGQTPRAWTCLVAILIWIGAVATTHAGRHDTRPLTFDRDIRPILSDHCFACHGPDEKTRKGRLRLDVADDWLSPRRSTPVVTPGQPQHSELWRRLVTEDPEERMPPHASGKPLDPVQRESIRRWIEAGGAWQGHWAWTPPQRPPIPRQTWRRRHPIDAFVHQSVREHDLSASPRADARTLLRRVSLDLTGLPPSAEDLETYLADPSNRGYERLVDRLLAKPQYGERMAQMWLDVARYADSDGYHDDTTRSMWPYRDYVIRSFNENKPFDRFTVEQLAGDLMEDGDLDAKVGSAFHRNGPTSSEGGADAKEYAARYAVDRVNTTATAWLGITLQCAECHDHKYDPFTTRDYYRMFAFFNQVPEDPLQRALHVAPTLPLPTASQSHRLVQLGSRIAELEARSTTPTARPETNRELEQARKERAELDASISRLRIMADVSPRRPTFILRRGDYRNPGDPVEPDVPAALGALPSELPANRLALARWLTQTNHPLTSRVFVNRLWQLFFGVGIVKTAEEFGSQGDRPTHPELLDWLAIEFVESGWDVKHMVRLITTSQTYRQSSRSSARRLRQDPDNRWLARAPRLRLPAENIRDNALAIAGLLDLQRPVGGPSIKPYQPGDLWREFSYGDSPDKSYVRDRGPDQYRRGLYVFWKRSVLHPELSTFDAPNREVCTARRPVTNTPLQAYVLLNDDTYIEAARVLAEGLLRQPGRFDDRLRTAFRRALARSPSRAERHAFRALLEETQASYRKDPTAARRLVSIGDSPIPTDLDPVEHAAWTCLANALLNLDETITRE